MSDRDKAKTNSRPSAGTGTRAIRLGHAELERARDRVTDRTEADDARVAPPKQGLIPTAIERTEMLISEVNGITQQVEEIGDRHLGGSPDTDDEAGRVDGVPDGAANVLHARLSSLDRSVQRLASYVSRLHAL